VTNVYLVAALLTAVALGLLVLPLWNQRRQTGRWSALGLGVSFAIVPVAFALYQYVSNWDPAGQERADRGAALINELEAQLARSPDNIQGWELLGHTYMMLGEHEKASRALREAWTRNPQDVELKLDYAEARILSDRNALDGDAGRLVEEVLASEPGNLRALWYGGHVALAHGDDEDAKARWSKILELDHPQEIEAIVRERLAALGEPPPLAPAPAGAASGPRTAAAQGPSVRLDVSLGAGRSIQQLPGSAALFIFARAPGGGPPLAVIRQPATAVPGQFTLSDANSMIPGRSLGDYDEITLVARLSKSGQPIEQPGDWKGQAQFHPKDGGTVALVIDQVVQ